MRERITLDFTYDPAVDAAYIYLTDHIPDGGVAYSVQPDDEDLRAGVNLDIDHNGTIIGIELLGASLLSPFLQNLIRSRGASG